MSKLFKTFFLTVFCLTFLTISAYAVSPAKIYQGAAIREKVENYIQNRFAGSGVRYQLEFVQSLPEIRLPQASDSINVSSSGEGLPQGNKVIKVTFYRQKIALRSIYVATKIHLFKKVWVTAYSFKRDEKISVTKLNSEEKDITKLNGEPLEKSPGSGDLVTRRSLPANKVLMKKDVRQPYLICKGHRLDVEYKKGNVRIILQTQALQNGGAGELIWVKNLDTRKRMRVKVVAPSLAVIP